MDNLSRKQIKSYILDYLKKNVPNFTVKGKMFTCPKCYGQSANIFPVNSQSVHCYSPDCGKIGDIFDVCRLLDFDNNGDVLEEDIAKFLIKEFSIQTNDKVEKLLAQYSEWNWDLVPVAKNTKASKVEKNWQNKSHKDLREWQQWLKNGLNIGVKGGEMSNLLIIDLDLIPSALKKKIYEKKASKKEIEEAKQFKQEKIELIKSWEIFDWNTVIQETFGGIHLFYLNDSDISKCTFDYEDIHIGCDRATNQAR